MLGFIRGKNTLAKADESLIRKLLPLGLTCQAQRTIRIGRGPHIAGGNVAGGLAAIGPNELSRSPHEVTQIGGRGSGNPTDATKGDPIIFAFENEFEDGSQARV